MIELTLLKTMLMLLATPGMIAPAATAVWFPGLVKATSQCSSFNMNVIQNPRSV
jgi:hypothetical protein